MKKSARTNKNVNSASDTTKPWLVMRKNFGLTLENFGLTLENFGLVLKNFGLAGPEAFSPRRCSFCATME